jgi:hypothetical protein
LKLEAELHDSFMNEAAAADRPASQIVREFMRDFVRKQREAREHDAWFRAEVERGILQADDPSVQRIAHDEIAAKWRRQRMELLGRSGQEDV